MTAADWADASHYDENGNLLTGERQVTLTPASAIRPRPVRWLWDGRIALGSLALLAGREGIGKSTVAYALAALTTRGRLRGVYYGAPRAVVVAATEDSWEHTIVPRLMAAGADLDLVFRVDVVTALGDPTGLSLPRDNNALRDTLTQAGASLLLLDPLMSRLGADLDSHKDAEVRLALEPITRIADEVGASVIGLIHISKARTTDPLNGVMGSKAFTAVARSVLYVMVDPEDDHRRMLGMPKNNLGRTDLPSLIFKIESAHVMDTDEGAIWTGKVVWVEETSRTIHDALADRDGPDDLEDLTDAAHWLLGHLQGQGGSDTSQGIKIAGKRAGHSESSLKRARQRLGATIDRDGFQGRTCWTLPADPYDASRARAGEALASELNELNGSPVDYMESHIVHKVHKVRGESAPPRARAEEAPARASNAPPASPARLTVVPTPPPGARALHDPDEPPICNDCLRPECWGDC